MCKKIKNWSSITKLYAIFIIIASVAVITVAFRMDSIGNNATVLSLIGIIATFVVISNYTQIVDVKTEIDNKIGNYKKLTNDVESLYKDNHYIQNNLSDITKTQIAQAMKRVNGNYNFKVSNVVDYNLIGDGIYYVNAEIIEGDRKEVYPFNVNILSGTYSPITDKSHNNTKLQ